MRKPIIVGNWKMNKTIAEAVEFINAVDPVCHDGATYGVATSFLALNDANKAAKNLIVAAENCHFEDNGAFTGEVSVPMLEEIGVKYCIIGHSERRQMFGDTDETVNKKAKRLIEAGITPIVCIGETEAQFDAGETEKVIRDQLTGSLADLCPKCVANIWSLLMNLSGLSEQVNQQLKKSHRIAVTSFVIRVREMYGDEAAYKVRVQYGGALSLKTLRNIWLWKTSMVH